MSGDRTATPGQARAWDEWYAADRSARTMEQDFNESKHDAMHRAFLAGTAHCPPPGRECDYPECAPTAADLAKWAAEHGAPCPGCESLRRQCSELAGEVGALAGVLTDIRDANPDAPARGYCTERARVALNLLHGSRLALEPARASDAYHEYVVRELNKSIDEAARLRDALRKVRDALNSTPTLSDAVRAALDAVDAAGPEALLLNATQERRPSREVNLITDDERDDPEEP